MSAPESTAVWKLRTRDLICRPLPALMGIINVTPDSFSDGGEYLTVTHAVEHALRLEDAGAQILDIGGESTRPYSEPVAVDDELRRVEPVLSALQGRVSAAISIDTSKASVAQAAIELGAEIINDVTGLEADPEMVNVAVASGAGVCAMHMQGTPQTMQDDPKYTDVVHEILDYLRQRDAFLVDAGIDPARICLDPGIGFGKSHEHNLTLIRHCAEFLQLGRPILIGHSRKGFVRKLVGDSTALRDAGTVGFSLAMAQAGMHVLRVHDVASTHAALTCFSQATDL